MQHVGPHRCQPPMRDESLPMPRMFVDSCAPPVTASFTSGSVGELWRCDECRQLWRIGLACNWCDAYGPTAHIGVCMTGFPTWRPAHTWQRLLCWCLRR